MKPNKDEKKKMEIKVEHQTHKSINIFTIYNHTQGCCFCQLPKPLFRIHSHNNTECSCSCSYSVRSHECNAGVW